MTLSVKKPVILCLMVHCVVVLFARRDRTLQMLVYKLVPGLFRSKSVAVVVGVGTRVPDVYCWNRLSHSWNYRVGGGFAIILMELWSPRLSVVSFLLSA